MGVACGGALLSGYWRGAEAGSCSLSLGVYLCSGAANGGTDTTQSLTGTPLQVETEAGFGIDVGSGNAFTLKGTGGLTFTDENASAITGQGLGILARNYSSGALDITVSGAVQGTTFAGIYALSYNGTGKLSLTTASVSGGRRGIFAGNYGSGGTAIDSTLGTVTGTQFQGLTANDRGAGDLVVTTASVSGGFHGIYARNYGGGLLTIDSTLGTVSATSNDGIFARNDNGGTLSITTAVVTGDRHGINARNRYSGNLLIDSTLGMVSGTLALGAGIYAREHSAGYLSIITAAVSGGTGINARNEDGGLLSIDSTLGLVTGTSYAGIDAVDFGAGDLTITTAAVTGKTVGISAINNSGGALTIDSTLGMVSSTGTSTNAIFARDYGDGGLGITTAAVTGNQIGIDGRNFGGGDFTIDSVAGTVTGTTHSGIYARDYGAGDLKITTAEVSGLLRGIYAVNDGGGALTIDTTAGAITGTAGYGIYAKDLGAGALEVTAGTVSGTRAILASNSGGDLTIVTHGVVTGSIFAVNATQTGSGALTLVNDGTLRHNSLSSVAPAVGFSADTDGATLRNLAAGTILGQVVFTAQDDLLENAGLWQSAGGITNFIGGTDELFNQAGGLIRAAGDMAAETTQLLGLEVFRNAGTASLVDGATGDRLVVSGDFIGVAGAVAFDVFLDDGSTPADRLVIGGASSGTTLVTLNVIGGSGMATVGPGTALIDVSATGDTAAGDFRLAGGPLIAGIYAYDLVLDSDGIWYLRSHALDSLGGYANLMTAAQIHVDLMAGAMSERLSELRPLDPAAGRGAAGQSATLGLADLPAGAGETGRLAVWLKGVAGQGDYAPAGAAAFEQDTQGFALGADVALEGLLLDGDRLYLGLMAGYGGSQGHQADSIDFDIQGWSFGLYASYAPSGGTAGRYDGLALDALLHASLLEASLDSSLPVSHAKTDMTAWGATLGVSYGLEALPGLILRPSAGLAYSSVAGDDFADSLGLAVALDQGQSLRGTLGLRLQRHWDLHGLGQIAPYLEGAVVEEFLDGNRISANGLSFESSLRGTSYRAGFGLDAGIGRALSLYGAVDVTWGERIDQATRISAGLRFSF
jgi:outer membrane autotransporter protein